MGQSLACCDFALDLPPGIQAKGGFGSDCSVSVDGRVVAMPHGAEKILVVDPTSRQSFAIDLPPGIKADRTGKFLSGCSVHGQVVAPPFQAEKILVVDPFGHQSFAVDLPPGIKADTKEKFWSSCSVNGQVVAVPFNAEKILVVDLSAGKVFAMKLPPGIKADRGGKFGSSCALNGQVVAVPFNAEKILVVDPTSRQSFAIDLPLGIKADSTGKFLSGCSVHGQVVAPPFHADKILVVDPSGRQSFALDLLPGIKADRRSKFRSSCSVNGQVVAVPNCSEKILVVDPNARQAFAIDLPPGIEPQRDRKFWSSCSVNGKVVAAPLNAEKFLLVDPPARQAFAQDWTPGISSGCVSICSVDRQVVAVPGSAEKILVVDVPDSDSEIPNVVLQCRDVHTRPDFAHLVAAMLSFWIYTDKPEPLSMERTTFDVHAVIPPGELGRGIKAATVTADLPSEKICFIVFKGTSGILDILNWNLEHDYEAAGGHPFFVHSGATNTIRNFQYLASDALASRLEKAHRQGVRKVVFTGHSLGGMYAQMFLFQAWKETKNINGQKSLGILGRFDLQSLTFGAPMVFGGSSQKANEFKQFAKSHAVNYIHADDPCPRAWGNLNLRHFVQQAAAFAKAGLLDTLGSIRGTVTSKVVEGMADQLLKHPDFQQIEDLARKYEHFVSLKVLRPTRQRQRWQEFQLTPECFKDHSVVTYVNKLFDAHDSSRPECYIDAQDPLANL
eukprot:Skav225406  [mRNA]  locus=scaffold2656:556543:558723:+ [translate_table: standard]